MTRKGAAGDKGPPPRPFPAGCRRGRRIGIGRQRYADSEGAEDVPDAALRLPEGIGEVRGPQHGAVRPGHRAGVRGALLPLYERGGHGGGRGRFTSYLNIFSGLAAYEILRDDGQGFTYEIRRCLYFDTCREHGYPEFCRVFCTHDWYALGVLKRHARFIRQSTIAENGTVCHDTIERVK